jgi:HAD superfamily hydrolase (TIGR01549 family)
MYNFIIFDVDGTLINTGAAVVAAYQEVIFEEFGRYFSEKEIFENYMFPTYERLKGFGVKNIEESIKKFHNYLMDAFYNLDPYEGIFQLLETLEHRNIRMGIVTARSRKEVIDDPCLQCFIKHFEYVVCADDTVKHKPEAEPLLKIIKEMKADISKTIYIGDTPSDYMCAKSSGIDFGLALWGAKNTENINAKYKFKQPEEILDIL